MLDMILEIVHERILLSTRMFLVDESCMGWCGVCKRRKGETGVVLELVIRVVM